MNITWNIWSYKYDGANACLCVESLIKKIPQLINKIIIWDDVNLPLDPEHSQRLSYLGCIVQTTTFNRNKNLLGLESFRGMSECYKKAIRITGCDFVAKIDSDILVVNDLPLKYIKRGWALFSAINNWNPYGNIYIMDSCVVDFAYQESLKSDPFINHTKYHNCLPWPFLEDRSFFISSLIQLGEERVLRLFENEFWTNWEYNRESRKNLKEKFNNNTCVNFGTRTFLRKFDVPWEEKRKIITETMQYVLNKI